MPRVSVCGFTPLRSDTADKGTSGVARYSHERPLLPRLGAFVGHEANIPYDYDELVATLAPRPVYVVQPQMDRDATAADVHAAMERARKVYALDHASEALALDEPNDIARFSGPMQDRAIAWLSRQLATTPPKITQDAP